MRRTVELRTFAIALIVGVGAATAAPLLKAEQAPSQPDVLSALLSEVHGLRTAIETMSVTSSRIQLSVARLQIEEQRMNDAGKQLLELRERLADAQRHLQENEQQSARYQQALTDANIPSGEREQMTDMIASLKAAAPALSSTVTRLSAEETQIAQDLSSGQTRWMEISRRLDDLESSLVVKK